MSIKLTPDSFGRSVTKTQTDTTDIYSVEGMGDVFTLEVLKDTDINRVYDTINGMSPIEQE